MADLQSTAASFDTIEALFEGIAPRKKLLLLDTCESGERDDTALTETMASGGKRGLKPRATRKLVVTKRAPNVPAARPYLFDRDRYIFTDLTRRTGTVVYSSSRGNELSWELESIANGVFTEQIMRALTSGSSGWMSVGELRKLVGEGVSLLTGDLQHPVIDRDNVDAGIQLPLVPGARAIVERH